MEKILLIEDEADLRGNLREYLEVYNYKVLEASNGLEGLEILRKELPGLVVCDVFMPEMDGFEVLEIIKRDPDTYAIPFIFLTALSDDEKRLQAMNLGADDYVLKPFENRAIRKIIASKIDKYKKIRNHFSKEIRSLKESVSHSIPYQIRVPLKVLKGFGEVLQKNYDQLNDDDRKSIIGNLNESADRMMKMIENYSMFLNITMTGPDELISGILPFNPGEAVSDISAETEKSFGREDSLILKPMDYPVAMKYPHFRKVISELCDNALRYSMPDKKIMIYMELNHDMLEISFTNYGRGFSNEEISLLHEREINLSDLESRTTGFGLVLVKKILAVYGGRLRISSSVYDKTTVIACFPVVKK